MPLVKSPNTTYIIEIGVLAAVEHIATVENKSPGVTIEGRVLTTRPVPACAKLASACCGTNNYGGNCTTF